MRDLITNTHKNSQAIIHFPVSTVDHYYAERKRFKFSSVPSSRGKSLYSLCRILYFINRYQFIKLMCVMCAVSVTRLHMEIELISNVCTKINVSCNFMPTENCFWSNQLFPFIILLNFIDILTVICHRYYIQFVAKFSVIIKFVSIIINNTSWSSNSNLKNFHSQLVRSPILLQLFSLQIKRHVHE